jgi:hypothetical protein
VGFIFQGDYFELFLEFYFFSRKKLRGNSKLPLKIDRFTGFVK